MKRNEFTAADIAATAVVAEVGPRKAGVWQFQNETAYRLADRLIQRERKAGNLKKLWHPMRWTWISRADSSD